MLGAKRLKNFFVVPLHFFWLYKYNQISHFGKRFRVVSTVLSLSCFLFFLLSVPPYPVVCKSWVTCPRALDGVSITFMLQFNVRKHYKTAIESEYMMSQGLFSQCLHSNLCTE